MAVPHTRIKISTMQDDLRAARGLPRQGSAAAGVRIPSNKTSGAPAGKASAAPPRGVALPAASASRRGRAVWIWLAVVLAGGLLAAGAGVWWWRGKGAAVTTSSTLFELLPAQTRVLLKIHSSPPPAGAAALREFLQAVGCGKCGNPAAVAVVADESDAVRRVALFSSAPAEGGVRVAKNWWAAGDREAVELLRQRSGQRFKDSAWGSDEQVPTGAWGELWIARQTVQKLAAEIAPLGIAGAEGGWRFLLGEGEGKISFEGEISRGEADESSPGAARDMLTAVPAQAFWAWGGADFRHDFNLWRLRNESTAPLADLLQELGGAIVETREGDLEQVLTKPALAAVIEAARGPYAVFAMREEDGSNSYGLVVALAAERAAVLPAALEALEPALAAWGKYIARVPVDAPSDFSEVEVRPGLKVRYVNFQGPSRSLDIAVLPDRLVITTSKHSMEAALAVSAETSLLAAFEPLLPVPEARKEKRLLLWDFAAHLQTERPVFAPLMRPLSRLGLVEYEGGRVQGIAPIAAEAE